MQHAGAEPARRTRPDAARRQLALHARLLDAAERTVARDGLAGLKARTLAAAVGCSVGAIYGAFPDLDALILAVNGRTLDAIGAAMAGGGGHGAERLAELAEAYLGYAAAHGPRWRALFQHRLAPGRAADPDYAARQLAAFALIEAPLAELRPALSPPARAQLARSLFAAVHGMVELGLDEKVASLSLPQLREQLRLVVGAVAAGLPGW